VNRWWLEFLGYFTKAKILQLKRRQEVVPKPGKQIKGDGDNLKKILDGAIAACEEMG
jgi:hypothetical protein